MKKCYLDANVLIYFKDEDSSHHNLSVETITKLTKEGVNLVISPLVLDEFLYVLQYLLRKSENKNKILTKALSDVLQLPHLKLISPPIEKEAQHFVLSYMENFNLRPRDAYHLLTMTYHEVTHFVTFDTDFASVFKGGIVKQILNFS